jgi:hypothetical protein
VGQIELHATNGREAGVDATAETARRLLGGQRIFEYGPHLGLHRMPVTRGAYPQAGLGFIIKSSNGQRSHRRSSFDLLSLLAMLAA